MHRPWRVSLQRRALAIETLYAQPCEIQLALEKLLSEGKSEAMLSVEGRVVVAARDVDPEEPSSLLVDVGFAPAPSSSRAWKAPAGGLGDGRWRWGKENSVWFLREGCPTHSWPTKQIPGDDEGVEDEKGETLPVGVCQVPPRVLPSNVHVLPRHASGGHAAESFRAAHCEHDLLRLAEEARACGAESTAAAIEPLRAAAGLFDGLNSALRAARR